MKQTRSRRAGFIAMLAVLVVAASLILAGCGGEDKETTATAPKQQKTADGRDFKKYRSSKENLEIQYPPDWTKQEGVAGTIAAFLSPKTGAQDFPESTNIVIEDLSSQPREISLGEYSDLSIEQLKKSIQNLKIVDQKDTTLAGEPAKRIVYTGTLQNVNAKWLQTWAIKNKKAYIITYTAQVKQFDNSLAPVEQMIESFVVN